MDDERKPLLDIETLIDRPKIKIDGEYHELVSPEELSILHTQRLSTQGKRLQALMDNEDLDDEGGKRLKNLVFSISDTIMQHVPAEARAKLTEMQRKDVIEAFTALLLRKRAGTAAAMLGSLIQAMIKETAKKAGTPKEEIGETVSPGSSGSTEATPDTGSPKPR